MFPNKGMNDLAFKEGLKKDISVWNHVSWEDVFSKFKVMDID